MMSLRIVLLSVILLLVSLSSTFRLGDTVKISFEDCGSQFELKTLSISTCSNVPCEVETGNFVDFTAVFDASYSPYAANLMKHEAFWIIDNIVQSAIIMPDHCENQSDCPKLMSTGLLTLSSQILVSHSLPKLNGLLHFKSTNAYGDVLMCYKVPVKVY